MANSSETGTRAKRGLVLFSGGLDSTLATLMAADAQTELSSLSIGYTGRPKGEIRAERNLRANLPFTEHYQLSIRTPGLLALQAPDGPKREGWIPYRNLMFWSLAAHQATRIGATFIVAGHDNEDARDYSDASHNFFEVLERILEFAGHVSARPPDMVLPLITKTDEELVLFVQSPAVQALVNETWSCWRDGQQQCGRCASCTKRDRFLDIANMRTGAITKDGPLL